MAHSTGSTSKAYFCPHPQRIFIGIITWGWLLSWMGGYGLQLACLFAAQSRHWVHGSGPARRQPTGQHGNQQHEEAARAKRERIGGADGKQKGLNDPSQG